MRILNLNRKIKQLHLKINTNLLKFTYTLSRIFFYQFTYPTSIIIQPSPYCNLQCKQCDLWKIKEGKQLSLGEGKLIIDKLKKWQKYGYIFFSGGEPLLNKNIYKIIDYAYKNNFLSHINTNASLINQNNSKEILKANTYAVSISLDGSNSQTHDYLRGVSGTYKKAISAIDLLQSKNSKIRIFINSVIMNKNVSQLNDLVNITIEKKIEGITFQNLLPNISKKTNEQTKINKSKLWPNYNIFKENFDKVRKNNKVLQSKEDLEFINKYYKNPNIINNYKCYAGINNFIIDHNGDVRMCFDFPPIGNILKDDPKKIWNSKIANKQRILIKKCQKACRFIKCNSVDSQRVLTSFSHFYIN